MTEDRPHTDITRPDSTEVYSESNQHVTEDIVEICRKYLVSEWKRVRTPYGLDAALEKGAASGPNCTERIFLDAGFRSWLAYFLASTGESHFEGRQAQVEAIAAFQNHSIEARRLAAKRVAETVPHPTVQNAISKILQEPKRRRLVSPTLDQEPRDMSFSTSSVHSTSSIVLPPPSLTQSGPTENLDTSLTDINLISDQQQQVLSNASFEEANIFPEYMSGAIRRDPIEKDGTTCWGAAVTMIFPYLPHLGKVDCLMSLAITEPKVPYVAMILFNVHIEVESVVQARQVVLHDGVILTGPEITLQGVHHEAIKKLLGHEIYEAIKASRVFQEERQKGTRATRCVSMIIPNNPSVGAVINLNLGLREATEIRAKLYSRR